MGNRKEERLPYGSTSAEAVGTLVAFLDTNGFDRRRSEIVNRLRALQGSNQFGNLPEDLRERVREIVASTRPMR